MDATCGTGVERLAVAELCTTGEDCCGVKSCGARIRLIGAFPCTCEWFGADAGMTCGACWGADACCIGDIVRTGVALRGAESWAARSCMIGAPGP